jgi:hypothetical protein
LFDYGDARLVCVCVKHGPPRTHNTSLLENCVMEDTGIITLLSKMGLLQPA